MLLAALFVGRTVKNFGLWRPFERAQARVTGSKTSTFLRWFDVKVQVLKTGSDIDDKAKTQ